MTKKYKKLKVFLSTIITDNKDKHIDTIHLIEKLIKKNGYSVNSNIENQSVISTSIDKNRSIKLIDDIRNSDLFIGEMSIPSQTLGFQIALAMKFNKPSLYLYPENLKKAKPKAPLLQDSARLLKIKSYNKHSLESLLINFLKSSHKKLLGDRITFECSIEIKEYIDVMSQKLGISKGELLRDIITSYINKNKLANRSILR